MQSDRPIDEERTHQPGMTITPQAGDVLFGNRPCSVQTLMTMAGEQWTHVALVINGDDGPRTVELGPQGMLTRSTAEFIETYRAVGLARPRGSDLCRQAMTTAAVLHLELDVLDYSWPHCVVIGSTAMLQRLAPKRGRHHIARTGLHAAQRLNGSQTGSGARRPATCSSLIVDLFDARCERCRPVLRWPSRSPQRPWEARPSPTDVVGLDGPPPLSTGRAAAATKLATPADIWVADGFAFRAFTDHHRTVVLRDRSLDQVDTSPPRCDASASADGPDSNTREGKEVTS